jgi:hypothetical protein
VKESVTNTTILFSFTSEEVSTSSEVKENSINRNRIERE